MSDSKQHHPAFHQCSATATSFLSHRRLEPGERPLQMVHDYLAAMGYSDPARVQQEAANSDLSCLIRFYSGEFVVVKRSGQSLNWRNTGKGAFFF